MSAVAPAEDLARRCEQLLADLGLPDGFDLEGLLGQLSEQRGRPVRLMPLLPGLRDEPSGLWVPLPDEDVIFAEASVSDWYRDHVVLHELGHMLFQHPGLVATDVHGWLGQYGVQTEPDTKVALRCWSSAREHEREAEMVALLVEARLSDQRQPAPVAASTPAEVAAVLQRLSVALGSEERSSRR